MEISTSIVYLDRDPCVTLILASFLHYFSQSKNNIGLTFCVCWDYVYFTLTSVWVEVDNFSGWKPDNDHHRRPPPDTHLCCGHFNVLLEYGPDDTLVARWGCETSVVTVIMVKVARQEVSQCKLGHVDSITGWMHRNILLFSSKYQELFR